MNGKASSGVITVGPVPDFQRFRTSKVNPKRPVLFFIVFTASVPTIMLFLWIERSATRVRGAPLSRKSRLLIPLPVILLLAGNLDAVLSLRAYQEIHPTVPPLRHRSHQAWNGERLDIPAILALLALPFVLTKPPVPQNFRFVIKVWTGHLAWMVFPYTPLLVICGTPIQD